MMNKDLYIYLGLFGLITIVVGLCSRRFKTAFIGGSIVGFLLAAVLATVTISVMVIGSFMQSAVARGFLQSAEFIGIIIGAVIVMGLLGLLGHSLRRGGGALLRRIRKSPTPQSSGS